MKKIIFFAVALVLLAAGCNKQPVYQSQNQATTTPQSIATTTPITPTTTTTPPVIPINPAKQPNILELNPSSGTVSSSFTISGSGFTSTDNTISFGISSFFGYASADGKTLEFAVPQSLAPYCPRGKACPQFIEVVKPGNYSVSVSNANGQSNKVLFTVVSSCPPNTMCANPPIFPK